MDTGSVDPTPQEARAHQEEALLTWSQKDTAIGGAPRVPDPSCAQGVFQKCPRGGVPARLTRITHASGFAVPGVCFKAMGSGLGLADRPGEDKPDSWASGHRPKVCVPPDWALPTPARAGDGDHPGRPPT